MTGPNYYTLELNRKTLWLLWLCSVLISAGLGIWQNVVWPSEVLISRRYFLIHCCLVGAVFGALSAACWVATAVKRYWIRYAFQAGIVLLFSAVLSALISYESWLLSLANCAGLIVSHNLLFGWMNIPFFNESSKNPLLSKRQFSVGGILTVTTVAALMMIFARRFPPPVRSDQYWLVLISSWIFIPLSGGVIAKAVLSRYVNSSLVWFGLGSIMIVAGTSGLAIAECLVSPISNGDGSLSINDESFIYYFIFYLAIFLGYNASMGATALAGRRGSPPQKQMPI